MKAPSKPVLLFAAAAALSLASLKLNTAFTKGPVVTQSTAQFHTVHYPLSDMLQELRYQLNHLTEGFSVIEGCPHRASFPR